jgi:integrase/recombinase XerD
LIKSAQANHQTGHPNCRHAVIVIVAAHQALAQVFPDVLAPPKGGAFIFHGDNLTGWLRRL